MVVIVSRITSYNVCYTKLLRNSCVPQSTINCRVVRIVPVCGCAAGVRSDTPAAPGIRLQRLHRSRPGFCPSIPRSANFNGGSVSQHLGSTLHNYRSGKPDVYDGIGSEFLCIVHHTLHGLFAGFGLQTGVFLNFAAHNIFQPCENIAANVACPNGASTGNAQYFNDLLISYNFV